MGMPRRIYTYSGTMGWNILNLITTVGSYIFAIGFLFFFVMVSLKRGAVAGNNPWDSPALNGRHPRLPPYNFVVIPTVATRHPLWEDRLGGETAPSSISKDCPLSVDLRSCRWPAGMGSSPNGQLWARQSRLFFLGGRRDMKSQQGATADGSY